MRKFLSYLLPFITACFALVPMIQFVLFPPYFEYWPMMIAVAGFLGVLILFINTNIFIKAISISTFVICFFGSSPYVCFNQYVSIMVCCYFYIGLTRMSSWKPMFVVLKSLLIIHSIFLIVQIAGHDQLLNFDLKALATYGIVGQHMQMGSFSIVLAACLSIISPLFFLWPVVVGLITKSTWTLLCAGVALFIRSRSKWLRFIAILVLIGAVVMCIKTGKIQAGLSDSSGRLMVWQKSIEILNQRPLQGWGPGMYKYIFPVLSEMTGVPWKTAHNDFIQFAFELGYILFGFLILLPRMLVIVNLAFVRRVFGNIFHQPFGMGLKEHDGLHLKNCLNTLNDGKLLK